jgi:hypothetical protein
MGNHITLNLLVRRLMLLHQYLCKCQKSAFFARFYPAPEYPSRGLAGAESVPKVSQKRPTLHVVKS